MTTDDGELFDVDVPVWGYLTLFPALVLNGLMLGAMGLFLSSAIKRLENFAGIMNFVIFPMFFLSSALYPLWKIGESSPLLKQICELNPFTYAVESIRFALYQQFNETAFFITVMAGALFLLLAVRGYNPAKGMAQRKGQP